MELLKSYCLLPSTKRQRQPALAERLQEMDPSRRFNPLLGTLDAPDCFFTASRSPALHNDCVTAVPVSIFHPRRCAFLEQAFRLPWLRSLELARRKIGLPFSYLHIYLDRYKYLLPPLNSLIEFLKRPAVS